MVVEADESDGSFLSLHPSIAVVTNIDPEHMDHYGTLEALKSAFVDFAERVPFDKLGDEVGPARVEAEIEEAHDFRVLDAGERDRFDPHLPHGCSAVEDVLPIEDLERDGQTFGRIPTAEDEAR